MRRILGITVFVLVVAPGWARPKDSGLSNFRILGAWTDAQRSAEPETQWLESSSLVVGWTPYEYVTQNLFLQPQIAVFPYANPAEQVLSLGVEVALTGALRVWRQLHFQLGSGIQGWLLYDRSRSASAFLVQTGLLWDFKDRLWGIRSIVIQLQPFYFLNEKPLVFPQAMQFRAGIELEL
jgi:hypothetical protein